MKVVHIIEALGGGVYTYFEDLTCHFEKEIIFQKVHTSILYSDKRKEIDSERVTALFASIPTVKIDMKREINFISDFKAVQELVQELKKIKPDVVHLHSSKAGVLGRIACHFLNQKPIIFYTPHGYAFLRTDISCFTKNGYWYVEKYFQKFLGGVTIACGDSEFELAKQLGKAEIIRNGIAISTIEKYSKPTSNVKLTIGIAGRITAARNPRQFNEIALKFPDYQFVWIGDGEERNQITATNINVTGWFLNKEQVYEQLNAVDIYLQTSLWEGLPIAILEAMALQKPVIATKIYGNKDTVVHNETGFLYQEIAELSNYFKILADPKIRAQMGNNAKIRCNDLFNTTKNFTALQDLYAHYFFALAKNFQK